MVCLTTIYMQKYLKYKYKFTVIFQGNIIHKQKIEYVLELWLFFSYKHISLDTTLCDIVCQWLATDLWFFPGTPVSSTNKTDRHDITEILLKVVLNTIKPTN